MNVGDVPANVVQNQIDVDSDQDSKSNEVVNTGKAHRCSHAWDYFVK